MKVGDQAPNFSVSDHEGTTVSLTDFPGQTVVLWFDPKVDAGRYPR